MQTRQVSRKLTPWLILIAAATLAALTYLLPVASTVDSPSDAHSRTAVALFSTSLFVGATIYLLIGLRGFTAGLRKAYGMIAAGIILFSLSMLQLPIIGLFDLWENDFVESGGVIVPFAASLVVVYAGMRRFTKLLQIPTRLTSFKLILGAAVVFSAFSGLIAKVLVMYPIDNGEDTYIGVVGWALVFGLTSFLLILKICRAIGQHYQPAMRSLAWAMGGIMFAILAEYIGSFIVTNGSRYVDSGGYLLPTIPGALLFVWASQVFYSLTPIGVDEQVEAVAGKAVDHDYVDSITGVASLASQPTAIDPFLDDLREITARTGTGALSEQDKQRLIAVYNKVETYLTMEDPIKHFSLTEIRQHVTPSFRALIERK